jgi:hypothetical protein
MKNKKYVDKVLNYLIEGTKIDMVKRMIDFPFNISLELYTYEYLPQEDINKFNGYVGRPPKLTIWANRFFDDMDKVFGLVEEEMEYVYKNYISYIDKEIGYS